MIDFKALAAPFAPDDISWRVGSTTKDKTKGMALAYLDARAVMDRLDAVCSPGGWQCRYSHAGQKTVCDIGILLGDWVWKADGAGDSDIEAEKGALSDAFKRAAVRWGIGRYLYRLDSPWVELEVTPEGRVRGIKKSEFAKLNALLKRPAIDAVDPADRDLVQGDGTKSQYDVNKHKEALRFTNEALDLFKSMSSDQDLGIWLATAISPGGKSTNRHKVARLVEAFPDLGKKIEAAANEVRLRTGARLQ